MCHHLEPFSAYSVNDSSSFLHIGDLELLLEEDRCLLVGGLDDPRHKYVIWRGRGGVQKGEKVDRLCKKIRHK